MTVKTEVARRTVAELRTAVDELEQTAEGDSNDAEIDAGREVADVALYLARVVTEMADQAEAEAPVIAELINAADNVLGSQSDAGLAGAVQRLAYAVVNAVQVVSS